MSQRMVNGELVEFGGIETADGTLISASAPMPTSGLITQLTPNFLSGNIATDYTFSIASGDFIIQEANANGESAIALSLDPFTEDTQSWLASVSTGYIPMRAEYEISVARRAHGSYGQFEIISVEDALPDFVPVALTSIQQATTILTIVMSAAIAGLKANDWIAVYGVTDTRLNYPNLEVATVSTDGLTVTATTSDEATITSVTAGPYASQGFVKKIDKMGLAPNGYAARYSGNSQTAAAFLARLGGMQAATTGTIGAADTVTVGTTAAVYTTAAPGDVQIMPTTRLQMVADFDDVVWSDKGVNSTSATYTARYLRTSRRSQNGVKYRHRLRGINAKSLSRPVAKIVSAVKSASTTATITTDVAHNLVTGNYVNIAGIRDTTNFANTANVAVTVTGTNTFTCVIATSATATSYGGMVGLSQGSIAQPGLLSQVGQSVAVTAGVLTLVGNTNWSTGVGVLNIGDYVNLYGVRDNTTGADLGVDGVYRVENISTTSLVLIAVTDSFGTARAPAVTTRSSTNCGGVVILRETLRTHEINIVDYDTVQVQLDGQGTTHADKQLPVYVVGGTISGTVTSNQGTSAANGSGWYVRPDNILVNDVASAALTSTTTTSAITPAPSGGAAEFNIIVTAVSGTTPTMDVVVQESDDAGTNWYDIYHFERITANGAYRSPLVQLVGNRLRYVQTLSGTTPSFTRTVNRVTNTMASRDPFRRILDRALAASQALNATTANLIAGSASNVQLLICSGAITTTAPAIQIQGSEDGSNWVGIGTPLTAVASSTVQATINNVNFKFYRGIVTTAGSGATITYVVLKAFG